MRLNVLTGNVGNVGNEFPVPMFGGVDNQAVLFSLLPAAKLLCSKKHAEFKRHVETRQSCFRIKVGAGDVVNAKFAFADDLEDFINSDLTAVINFQRATRNKPTVTN